MKQIKKAYEGKKIFTVNGVAGYECTYPKECAWRLNYEEAKFLPLLNPLHPKVPHYEGYMCYCPDFDRGYKECPSKLTKKLKELSEGNAPKTVPENSIMNDEA